MSEYSFSGQVLVSGPSSGKTPLWQVALRAAYEGKANDGPLRKSPPLRSLHVAQDPIHRHFPPDSQPATFQRMHQPLAVDALLGTTTASGDDAKVWCRLATGQRDDADGAFTLDGRRRVLLEPLTNWPRPSWRNRPGGKEPDRNQDSAPGGPFPDTDDQEEYAREIPLPGFRLVQGEIPLDATASATGLSLLLRGFAGTAARSSTVVLTPQGIRFRADLPHPVAGQAVTLDLLLGPAPGGDWQLTLTEGAEAQGLWDTIAAHLQAADRNGIGGRRLALSRLLVGRGRPIDMAWPVTIENRRFVLRTPADPADRPATIVTLLGGGAVRAELADRSWEGAPPPTRATIRADALELIRRQGDGTLVLRARSGTGPASPLSRLEYAAQGAGGGTAAETISLLGAGSPQARVPLQVDVPALAARLRRAQGLEPPSLAPAAPGQPQGEGWLTRIGRPVIWAHTPLDEGILQWPVPNLTDEMLAELAPPGPVAPRASVLSGAARFGPRRPDRAPAPTAADALDAGDKTWPYQAGELPWAIEVAEAAAATAAWELTTGSQPGDTRIRSVGIGLVNPVFRLDGFLWHVDRKPAPGQAIPVADGPTACRPVPLRHDPDWSPGPADLLTAGLAGAGALLTLTVQPRPDLPDGYTAAVEVAGVAVTFDATKVASAVGKLPPLLAAFKGRGVPFDALAWLPARSSVGQAGQAGRLCPLPLLPQAQVTRTGGAVPGGNLVAELLPHRFSGKAGATFGFRLDAPVGRQGARTPWPSLSGVVTLAEDWYGQAERFRDETPRDKGVRQGPPARPLGLFLPTVPGVELRVVPPRDAANLVTFRPVLRYDLPALDEAHALARLPTTDDEPSPEGDGEGAPTTLDPAAWFAFVREQARRVELTRVDGSVAGWFDDGMFTVVTPLLEGTPPAGTTGPVLDLSVGTALGAVWLLGKQAPVDDILAGQPRWVGGDGSLSMDERPSDRLVQGYAVASALDPGGTLLDGCGISYGPPQLTTVTGVTTRSLTVSRRAEPGLARRLATSGSPLAIDIAGKSDWTFWFADLPLDAEAGTLAVADLPNPREAWSRDGFAAHGFSWGLQDLAADPAAGQGVLNLFGLGFRPRRLARFALPGPGGPDPALVVLGELSLLHADAADAAGNIVALGFDWTGSGLVLSRLSACGPGTSGVGPSPSWDQLTQGAPPLVWPLHVAPANPAEPWRLSEENRPVLELAPAWAKGGPSPPSFPGTLSFRYLGTGWALPATLEAVPGGPKVSIQPPSRIAGTGFAVTSVQVTLVPGNHVVEASWRLAIGPAGGPLLQITCDRGGSSVTWLQNGLNALPAPTLRVDHGAGTLTASLSWSGEQANGPQVAIFRGNPQPLAALELAVAFTASPGSGKDLPVLEPRTGVAELAVSLRGDLPAPGAVAIGVLRPALTARHTFWAKEKEGWSSHRLALRGGLMLGSTIAWPLVAPSPPLPPASDTLTLDGNATARHTVMVRLEDHEVDPDCITLIQAKPGEKAVPGIAPAKPWRFAARTRHRLEPAASAQGQVARVWDTVQWILLWNGDLADPRLADPADGEERTTFAPRYAHPNNDNRFPKLARSGFAGLADAMVAQAPASPAAGGIAADAGHTVILSRERDGRPEWLPFHLPCVAALGVLPTPAPLGTVTMSLAGADMAAANWEKGAATPLRGIAMHVPGGDGVPDWARGPVGLPRGGVPTPEGARAIHVEHHIGVPTSTGTFPWPRSALMVDAMLREGPAGVGTPLAYHPGPRDARGLLAGPAGPIAVPVYGDQAAPGNLAAEEGPIAVDILAGGRGGIAAAPWSGPPWRGGGEAWQPAALASARQVLEDAEFVLVRVWPRPAEGDIPSFRVLPVPQGEGLPDAWAWAGRARLHPGAGLSWAGAAEPHASGTRLADPPAQGGHIPFVSPAHGLSGRASAFSLAGAVLPLEDMPWIIEKRLPMHEGMPVPVSCAPADGLAARAARLRLPSREEVGRALSRVDGNPDPGVIGSHRWLVPPRLGRATIGDRPGAAYGERVSVAHALTGTHGGKTSVPALPGASAVNQQRAPRPPQIPVPPPPGIPGAKWLPRLPYGRHGDPTAPVIIMRGPLDGFRLPAGAAGDDAQVWASVVAPRGGRVSDAWDGSVALRLDVSPPLPPGGTPESCLEQFVAGNLRLTLVIGAREFKLERIAPARDGARSTTSTSATLVFGDPTLPGAQPVPRGLPNPVILSALQDLPAGARPRVRLSAALVESVVTPLPVGQGGAPVTMDLPLDYVPATTYPLPLEAVCIAFHDPVYDAELGSEPLLSQVVVERAGMPPTRVGLHVDRKETNPDGTLFLMVDAVPATGAGLPALGIPSSTALGAATLLVSVLDGAGGERPLRLDTGADRIPLDTTLTDRVHLLSLSRLRAEDGTPYAPPAGSRLRLRVDLGTGVKEALVAELRVVEQPTVPPPTAGYLLLELDSDRKVSRAAAWAWAPQPDRVEFVDLAADLRSGFVRRIGCFRWTVFRRAALGKAAPSYYLQKIDHSGATRLPATLDDFHRP